jgi:fructose-1,6-bisphosphatase/sedoheptulose 1,7-bisphosphatase-like protein
MTGPNTKAELVSEAAFFPSLLSAVRAQKGSANKADRMVYILVETAPDGDVTPIMACSDSDTIIHAIMLTAPRAPKSGFSILAVEMVAEIEAREKPDQKDQKRADPDFVAALKASRKAV